MPRRSSGRSASRPATRAAPVRNPPAPAQTAPPPAHAQPNSGGMLSGIGSTIAQGMAFGTGSAMAHRAVDSVLGPRTVEHQHVNAEPSTQSIPTENTRSMDSCISHTKAFQECINTYGSDISKCQFYLDMLNECRRGPAPVNF